MTSLNCLKKIETHKFNLLLDWAASKFQIVPELEEGVQLKDLSQVMPAYDGVHRAGKLLEEEVDAVTILQNNFVKGRLPGLKNGTSLTSLVVKALHRDSKFVTRPEHLNLIFFSRSTVLYL